MGCCLSRDEVQQNYTQIHKKPQDIRQSQIYMKQKSSNNASPIKSSMDLHLNKNSDQALIHKAKGNQLFKTRKYKDAIEQYKLAIMYDFNGQPTFYTNLSLAQKADKLFLQSYETIVKMFEIFNINNLQNTLISKAKIIQARSLIGIVRQYCVQGSFNQSQNKRHKQYIEEAIKILQKLNQRNSEIKNEIKNLDANYQKQLEKAIKVKQYLKKYVLDQSKQEFFINYIKKRVQSDDSSVQFDKKLGNIFKDKSQLVKNLQQFNRKMLLQQQQNEQEQLIDPIIYEPFVTPFLLPSGHTYQKSVINDHFKLNNFQDPMTRQKFTPQKTGVVNLTLKRYILQLGKKVNKDDLVFIEL